MLNFFKKIFFNKKEKKFIFPCKNCIVLSCCTKICDKINLNQDELTKNMREYIDSHNKFVCPDCESENFLEGPSGGMSTNIQCFQCKHWFNTALPFFIERIKL